MKIIFTFSLLAICTILSGQIIVDKTSYDLGDVRKEDGKFVDFKLTNASQEEIKILRSSVAYGTRVKFSGEKIAPDESVFVRIKYTPKRKGPFETNINVWVSSNNEPIMLTVVGKAITFDVNEDLECPDFTDNQDINDTESHLRIKVIDQGTKDPIEGAVVDILWDGLLYKSLITDAVGVSTQVLKRDYYYVLGTAEGYGRTETDIYLNDASGELIVELSSGNILAFQDEPEEPDTVEYVEPEEPVEEKPIVTSEEFPEDQFAPNNIVFLIDVSVSMRQRGKMDLLKAAMIEMTFLMRPIDKIAIVTYSSNAKLVMKSTSADKKQKIMDVIRSLEPAGATAGTKGIKKAYQVLEKNYVENGNNQIFISTDGAFNLQKKDKKLLTYVEKNSVKGYKLSVVGIKNDKWTVKNMKKLADEGNGNYLHLKNYKTAKEILVEEIREQSQNVKNGH